jgi:hypothetical protein
MVNVRLRTAPWSKPVLAAGALDGRVFIADIGKKGEGVRFH